MFIGAGYPIVGNIYLLNFNPPSPTSHPTAQPSSPTFQPTSKLLTNMPTLQSTVAVIDTSFCSTANGPSVQDKIRSYLYISFVVSFAAIGLLINSLRKRSDKLLRFSPLLIIVEMGILGLDMISDIVYIIALYSTDLFDNLATVMLIARMIHPCISIYVVNIFFGNGKSREYYSKLIDRNNLGPNAKLYGLLLLIALVETTAIKFMPWMSSEFSVHSGGYPDMFMFRLCGYSKIVQSLISLVVQMIVLIHFNHNAGISSCKLVFVVTFVSTVLVVVVTVFEIVFQVFNVDDIAVDTGTSRVTERETSIGMTAVRINDEVINPVSARASTSESISITSKSDSSSSISMSGRESSQNPILNT